MHIWLHWSGFGTGVEMKMHLHLLDWFLDLISFQNTVIVECCWKVPLSKEGKPPKLHPRRHRVYRLVDDTKHKPQDKMELILTQTVPSECFCLSKNISMISELVVFDVNIYFTELGGRGDTVFVKKSLGRNKLLLQGLAVYPSQENKDMFAEEIRVSFIFKSVNLSLKK